MTKQVMEQALEALTYHAEVHTSNIMAYQLRDKAIATLKEAIKQAGEPVAWLPRDKHLAKFIDTFYPPAQPSAEAWKPIETAPKDEVFIVSDGESVSVGWWSGDGLANWLPANCQPTHWMQLPAAPSYQGDKP